MTAPEFLTLDDVLQIHEASLAAYGGQDGIRNRDGLESAVAAPQATFGGEFLHADLFEMAAAYGFHIAQSQAFLDGNKRTGLGAVIVFLGLNGFDLGDRDDQLYSAFLGFAEKTWDKARFAALLREFASPRPTTAL